MPYLIDGNNLLHAVAKVVPDVSRSGLVALLARLAREGEAVTVVFDGHRPQGRLAEQIGQRPVHVVWSEDREADALVIERIEMDSAPRRLTVVSTDREIRAAARHRRCPGVRSEEFVATLLAAGREAAPRVEPGEKYGGLAPGEVERWLKEFGLDGEDRV